MVKQSLRVLFLGKQGDAACGRARSWCQERFTDVAYFDGRWGEPLPDEARVWEGDLIISYLSRWVVPRELLGRATVAAINFHPASPEYPGIGCNNFALYEGAASYGATCHHMAAAVDTGPIIQVVRFPLEPQDCVATLLERTYAAMEKLFVEVMQRFVAEGRFPAAAEQWTRPPFTRAQFEALRRISPDMPAEEVARRVRATDYPPWGPYVELHGFRFQLVRERAA